VRRVNLNQKHHKGKNRELKKKDGKTQEIKKPRKHSHQPTDKGPNTKHLRPGRVRLKGLVEREKKSTLVIKVGRRERNMIDVDKKEGKAAEGNL